MMGAPGLTLASGVLHLTAITTDHVALAVFFVVGLLGGAHCLGMCGPLVTTYADRLGSDRDVLTWREVRQHGLFNVGRTLGYAAVGGLAGLLGGAVFDTAAVFAVGDGVRGVLGVGVGVAIVVAGVGYVVSGTTAGGGGLPHFAARPVARVTSLIAARIDRWVGGPRIVGLGALHALLPCPIIYPAYLYAFGRGSPVEGAAALAAVGLGTFPTLFVYGTALGAIGGPTRRRLHRALGVAFVIAGLMPISHGLMLLGVPVPHVEIPIYQPLG